MPAETEQEENVLQNCDARGKCGACPARTESVSSVCWRDENRSTSDIVVEKDGEIRYFGRALLDSGSTHSFVSESTAIRAEALGVATIDRSDSRETKGFDMVEGFVKGAGLKVERSLRLKFSLDGALYYRHTFIVVPNEDRYEMLLGKKLLDRIWERQNSAAFMPGLL